VWASASSGATRCHVACVRGCPCNSSTGVPAPPYRTRNVAAPTSIRSRRKPSNMPVVTTPSSPAQGAQDPVLHLPARWAAAPPPLLLAGDVSAGGVRELGHRRNELLAAGGPCCPVRPAHSWLRLPARRSKYLGHNRHCFLRNTSPIVPAAAAPYPPPSRGAPKPGPDGAGARERACRVGRRFAVTGRCSEQTVDSAEAAGELDLHPLHPPGAALGANAGIHRGRCHSSGRGLAWRS
jgi:hypothetical protein